MLRIHLLGILTLPILFANFVLAADAVVGATEPERLTSARTADGKQYISWKEHRIDDSLLAGISIVGSDGLAISDLDRDGRMDVVAVHEDCGHHLRISFGTGDPDRWESFTLSPGVDETRDSETVVGAAEDVVIGDVNGDRRLDIVACGEAGAIVYFEASEFPRTPSGWKRTAVAKPLAKRSSWIRVDLGDLDGDGKLEIFGANKGGTDWVCFHCAGQPSDPQSWTRQVIGTTQMPINIQAVDIDGDGDLDVLGGSRGESKIVLFENLSNGKSWPVKWRERTLVEGKITLPTPAELTIGRETVPVVRQNKWGTSGFMAEFADLDGDGRMDIITETKHSGALIWLRQPASLDVPWRIHYIGEVIPDHATGLKLADINDDGLLDLFVGGYSYTPRRVDTQTLVRTSSPCGRLAWFEQNADPTQPWKRHDISRPAQGMYDMMFDCDVNGDGLIDFIATRGNSAPVDGVIWLEQVRTAHPVAVFTSAWPAEHRSREQPLPSPP